MRRWALLVVLLPLCLPAQGQLADGDLDWQWVRCLARSDFVMVAEVVERAPDWPDGYWSGQAMVTQVVKYRPLYTPWGRTPREEVVEVHHVIASGEPDIDYPHSRLIPERFASRRKVIVAVRDRNLRPRGRLDVKLFGDEHRYFARQPRSGTPAADRGSLDQLRRAIVRWRSEVRTLCQTAELVFVGNPEDDPWGPDRSVGEGSVRYRVGHVLQGQHAEPTIDVSHALPQYGSRMRAFCSNLYGEVFLFFKRAIVFAVRDEDNGGWRDVSGTFSAIPARPNNVNEVRRIIQRLEDAHSATGADGE